MLLVDFRRCTGCRTCEMACSLHHEGKCSPLLARNRVVKFEARGISVPTTCANCSRPYCMLVCPVRAISLHPVTGAVVVDEQKCLGCRACALACPLGQAGYHPEKQVAMKCNLCDGDPVCVQFCPSGALRYGYLDDSLQNRRREFLARLLEQEGGGAHAVRLDR
ncbi:MAG: 4Fe-4S dicluster domain-containing protein [Desulfurispora sp.]|uniref:4Fe-4S dicluster domain-containing protein n=1 Tax=Desulfurispora sp. TaxID=3014275 RepID=UPI0040496062